jgi:hypothetical protein
MRASWCAAVVVLLVAPPAFADVPGIDGSAGASATGAGAGWVLLGTGDATGATAFFERELPIVRHLSLVPRAGFLFASRTDHDFGAARIFVNGVEVASSPGHTITDRAWSAFADLDLMVATGRVGNMRLGFAAGPSLRYLSHRRPTGGFASLSAEEGEVFEIQYQHDRGFDPGVCLGLRADIAVARTLVGLRSAFYQYTEGTPVLMVAASVSLF